MPPTNWMIQHHAVLDSTNLRAHAEILARWQRNEPAHGIAIVAETQTAGRGQHGRTFASPRGGLYLSAVVETLPPNSRHLLAIVAGVAAATALNLAPNIISRSPHRAPQSLAASRTPRSSNETEPIADPLRYAKLNLQVQLRWPNDLVLAGKKLGGILVDSVASGSNFAAIIGIGVNVNSGTKMFPPQVRPRAISLRRHTGHFYDVTQIQTLILTALSKTLHIISNQGLATVIDQARALDSLLGQNVEWRDGAHSIHGIAAGIGPQGELLIRCSAGTTAHHTGSIMALNGQRIR